MKIIKYLLFIVWFLMLIISGIIAIFKFLYHITIKFSLEQSEDWKNELITIFENKLNEKAN